METKAITVSTLIPAPRTHKFIPYAEMWKGEDPFSGATEAEENKEARHVVAYIADRGPANQPGRAPWTRIIG
jgi:hypothetical protein